MLRFTKLQRPRIAYIEDKVLKTQFTDGGGASGTYSMGGSLPIGAEVIACQVMANAWSGDTSAVITVGDGSDVDRYNTGTPSIFAAVTNGVAMGVPSGIRYHAAAITPVITITGGSDFTALPAAAYVVVKIAYLDWGVGYPTN